MPLKQACLLGHSPSDLHPSSMTGSGTEFSFTTALRSGLPLKLLTWCACYSIGVPSKTGPACAVLSVSSGTAICIGCTLARCFAFLLLASQWIWTVLIPQAFIGEALHIWISLVILQASTSWFVILNTANCIDATLLIGAWVLAFLLDAGLSQWALIITLTPS